jgi:uncharacterized protein YqgV (UPF0045/DUF77 family)
MKLIMSAFCVAALSGALVAAQASEVKTKQKIEVKDGKKVTVSGCVTQAPDGLMLTDVEGNVSHSYMLVGKSDDIAKHVGHRVEITGKAADRGDGKVKVETKTKAPGAPEQKAESKSEGDLDVPLLGVDHVKMIGKSCR